MIAKYSVITPVYRNAEFVPLLIEAFSGVRREVRTRFGMETEFVFVVDASPDDSYDRLKAALPDAPFPSQLLLHARNFGSFAAIRTGLAAGSGNYFGAIAADLQEPPELLVQFLEKMVGDSAGNAADIVVGRRESRADKSRSAAMFWWIYRRFVMREVPEGGVDLFGCNRQFRDEILRLEEAHSSLIGQLFWVGFRRAEVLYGRRERQFGVSAWTFRKKLKYMMDSIFAFTDLPVRVLSGAGFLGIVTALTLGLIVFLARITGMIEVPGYAALSLVVMFFGALNLFGIGLIGSYAWRAYENTKRRPLAIVRVKQSFNQPRD